MFDVKTWLFIALGGFAAFYLFIWLSAIRRERVGEWPIMLGIGFVTNFFDTLGIGSFATTTSFFKFLKKDVVVANDPMPSVSKKFVTKPMPNIIGHSPTRSRRMAESHMKR